MNKVNFLLCLHNHQPTGNFDSVFEMACGRAYEPFLDVLERHPGIRLTFHFSGCLMEWIEEHRPAMADRIAELVSDGRVELMGGGFYEPILAMLPDRDKIGQVEAFREYLENRFSTKVRGAWLTERVWEQSLTTPLVQAGVEYVIVDDSHFRNAGLHDRDLNGYYVTEDQGHLLAVFSGSERLRYLIPFDDPWKTTEHLRSMANADGDAIVAYGDDGEKFGLWPETYEHVYEKGWLDRFFEEMERQAGWVNFITFSEAIDTISPKGTIYLPDASYREMMEWALPAETLMEMEDCMARLKQCGAYEQADRFLRGGMWRNFKHKYPELQDMYGRMLRISEKVKSIQGFETDFRDAQTELYKGQCCCAWWHGVFGGLYLPHLRFAVYEHLLRAEAIADRAVRDEDSWLDADIRDINVDTKPEVLLSNGRTTAVFTPAYGGHLAEFSMAGSGINLLNTITRRKEGYHRDVSHAQLIEEVQGGPARSIHDMILCKEHGLEKYLHYDWYRRQGLIDHFFGPGTTLESLAQCRYDECADFVDQPYTYDIKRGEDCIWLQLRRVGQVHSRGGWQPFAIEKVICFRAGAAEIECGYRLANLSDGPVETIFGIETGVALLGSDGDKWRYRDENGGPMGRVDETLDLSGAIEVGVTDRVAAMDIAMSWSEPAGVWAFPVYSVCNSEAGFEKTFQNIAVVPHWRIAVAPGEDWQVRYSLAVAPLDTGV